MNPVNPSFGLASLWQQGDLVARGVGGLLVAMSLLSWFMAATQSGGLGRIGLIAEPTP